MQYQTLRSVNDNHVFAAATTAGLKSCPIMSAIKAHGRRCIAGRSTSSRQTTAGRSHATATHSWRPISRCSSRRRELRRGGLVRRSGLPQCRSTDWPRPSTGGWV